MRLDPEFAIGLILTGLITFWSVYLGVRLAARRERYHQHLDRLKNETVDVLERWANDIAVNFSVTSVPFETLDERDRRPLKGYERRYYWDVPEIFQRPWDERDIHRLQMAASHWPDLEDWNRITELGRLTYRNTGVLHQALVHMDDGVNYPPQPRSLGDWENLQVESPGRRARTILRQSFIEFTNREMTDLVKVINEEGRYGIVVVRHLVGVFDDRKKAVEARDRIAAQLTHAPEAARAVLKMGDAVERAADRHQKRALALIYEADTAGGCPGCTKVAPKRERLAVAWRTFWARRKESGWRRAWADARYRFRNGFFRPEKGAVEATT